MDKLNDFNPECTAWETLFATVHAPSMTPAERSVSIAPALCHWSSKPFRWPSHEVFINDMLKPVPRCRHQLGRCEQFPSNLFKNVESMKTSSAQSSTDNEQRSRKRQANTLDAQELVGGLGSESIRGIYGDSLAALCLLCCRGKRCHTISS